MYAKVDGEVQVFRELKYKNVKPLYLIDEYGNVSWRHITNNYIFPKVNVIRTKNGRFSKVGSTGK